MRFKVGQKVRVVKPDYGTYFHDGDVVEITSARIIDDGNETSYFAKYENDRMSFPLYEYELEPIEDNPAPITNGDKIRSMSNRELSEFLFDADYEESACEVCPHRYTDDCAMKKTACVDGYKAWLNSPVDDKE